MVQSGGDFLHQEERISVCTSLISSRKVGRNVGLAIGFVIKGMNKCGFALDVVTQGSYNCWPFPSPSPSLWVVHFGSWLPRHWWVRSLVRALQKHLNELKKTEDEMNHFFRNHNGDLAEELEKLRYPRRSSSRGKPKV